MPQEKTIVSDICDRRNESRRYAQANYWDEWTEVWRAVKCRTLPIMVTDRAGNQVEDTTRTNVCMPELSLIRRRKVARLTANMPQINYITPDGENSPVAMKLTALAYQQFDRSGENREHKRIVDSGITFGRGISQVKFDTVEIMRKIRKRLMDSGGSPTFKDRASLMEFQGSNQDDIDAATAEYGTQLDDDLIKQLMAEAGGNEVTGNEPLVKYAGPIVTSVFIGDFYDEPGCRCLDESSWAMKDFIENDIFLQKMLRKKYRDPETGQMRPVFDLKACEELMDLPMPNVSNTQQPFDLRAKLRTQADGQTTPLYPMRLIPGKRFNFIESHQRDEYGLMWKTWIGNEKVLMGKMPYEWDLYGRYEFSEFVPLPDPINAVGDSTPRLMRFLHFLHNATVGQRKDLVNTILRPMMKVLIGEDLPDEVIERKLMRLVYVKSMNGIQPMQESNAIGAALTGADEEEAQIMRMMAMCDPNLMQTDSGTTSNPMAGKTATTAVLAAKSADALTQFELDNLNAYLKDTGEKKLWMNQQSIPEGQPLSLGAQYVDKVQGLSERYGHSTGITIDMEEIQEDIQVEPAAGSMLAVDDDLRRNAAMQFYGFASQNPAVFNINYAAEFLASTIRGIDPGKAINPPAPPQPPPPKVSVAIAVKWPEIPPEVQAQLLQGAGAQVSDDTMNQLDEEQQLQDVVHTSEAADHAQNLYSQAQLTSPEQAKPNGAGKKPPVQ
jgi:hypothetical protein